MNVTTVRPTVGLPMGFRFLECIAMDFKFTKSIESFI